MPSPAHSVSCSTVSSPRSTHGAMDPGTLTPRSKVKAMLAALDDESDEESLSTRKQPIIDGTDYNARENNVQRSDVVNTEGESSGRDDEDDESDVVAPRGKLAARLHRKRSIKENADTERVESEDAVNAYERVKQQLIRKSPRPEEMPAEQAQLDDTQQNIPGKAQPMEKLLLRRKKPAAIDSNARKSPFMASKERTRSLTTRLSSNLPLSGALPAAEGPSLGPFLSPIAPRSTIPKVMMNGNESDSDLPADPQVNAKFLALVARKRKERQEKEAVEERKRAERDLAYERNLAAQDTALGAVSEDDSEENTAARKTMTQQARPIRKASKKAVEEMNRETQRISRNMQLAHQAKTKKKISKASLLARFNFRDGIKAPTTAMQPASSSAPASSAPVSDVEGTKGHETPPTSPATPNQKFQAPHEPQIDHAMHESSVRVQFEMDDELPTIEDMMAEASQSFGKGKGILVEESIPSPSTGKGKGKLIEEPVSKPATKSKKTKFTQPPIKVKPPQHRTSSAHYGPESESDLEILPSTKPKSKSRTLDIFDRLPVQKIAEGRTLQKLRALAHLTSPGKEDAKSRNLMAPAEMQRSLQRRARQQAAKERAEKIQDLKDRGIIVQTAEERERDQAVVEDLLEKARREGEEMAKQEKDAAKRERIKNGETENIDSSDDEDYQEEEVDDPIVDVSGSGEEEEQEADDEEEEEQSDEEVDEIEDDEMGGVEVGNRLRRDGNLIADEASEGSDDESNSDQGSEKEDEKGDDLDAELNVPSRKRRGKAARILEDEDDEDDDMPVQPRMTAFDEITNPLIPILPGSDEAPMGLTQAFAATMADSQTQMDHDDQENYEQDSLLFLRGMPEPKQAEVYMERLDNMVPDSQLQPDHFEGNNGQSNQDSFIDIHLSQSQNQPDIVPESTHLLPTSTQYSDIPDPSQDAGFGLNSPVANRRFVSVPPPSTIDTVLLGNDPPVEKRKGKLRRRVEIAPLLSDLDDADDNSEVLPDVDGQDFKPNAFNVMKKAAQKKPSHDVEAFDKKKSEAKGMVEEQAEESEDEYAGLGGASGDDSADEEDEEIKKMIDEGEVKVDERKLAAFYANKERASDEKAVEKLFKDINSGMLRKKRGADFDLSDSEDDLEARRRVKQREFAKMRKALLANESVGKIAQDPKKSAFLRAIEDRDDDNDNLDFLEESQQPDSQATQDDDPEDPQRPTLPAPALVTTLKRKRPLTDSFPDAANRPPPAARRTVLSKPKKPSTLAELRASVSFLVEDPNYVPAPHDPSSDLSDHDPPAAPPPRRTAANPVVDRLSLQRAQSASVATTSGGAERLAFLAPSAGAGNIGFKVPSLLRRATTQLVGVGGSDKNGISMGRESAAAGGGGEGLKRKGTKRSSVNWRAREMERGEGVREVERRREEERKRMSEGRRGLLGLLGVGSFD